MNCKNLWYGNINFIKRWINSIFGNLIPFVEAIYDLSAYNTYDFYESCSFWEVGVRGIAGEHKTSTIHARNTTFSTVKHVDVICKTKPD